MRDDAELVVKRGTHRLDGHAVDEHGQPVARARISLDHARYVVSDDAGRFGFADLAPGRYALGARKDDLCADGALVTVREGRQPIVLTMSPGITLRVHVMDGGSPVHGARILVVDDVVGATDAEGLAVLRGVRAQFQMFEVAADGYAPAHLSMWLASDPGGTIERVAALVRGAPLGGRVIGPDGAAVPDAVVHISSESWSREAATDPSGGWRVAAVAAGTYQLLASSEAYAPAPALILDLDGTTAQTDVTVPVVHGGSILGQVVDGRGAAVARPFIVMINTQDEFPQERTVRGDDNGEFEMRGVAPSTYRLFAHENHRASAETRVALEDGEVLRIDFVVDNAAISGVVLDTRGNPVAGADVRAVGDLVRGDVSDLQGRFELGAFPPGQYEIQAHWPHQQERGHGASTKAATGDAIARLVLPVRATIAGRVLLDGTPMQHFGVLLTTCPQFPWVGRPVGVHDAVGHFLLEGVAPGSWGIVVAGPGTAMYTVSEITVEEGGAIDLGDLHMTRGQNLQGHVRDSEGAPVAGARVTIGRRGGEDGLDDSPLQQWFTCNFETATDADGAFAFQGVTSVRAPNARPTPISATHRERGTSVAVAVPQGDATIDLTLVDTGTIEGVIDQLAGRLVMISAHRRGHPSDLRDGTVTAPGRVLIDRLPPGDYMVVMTTTPGSPTAAPVNVTVVAGQRTSVRLVVDRVEDPG